MTRVAPGPWVRGLRSDNAAGRTHRVRAVAGLVLTILAVGCGGRDDEPPRPIPTGDAIPVDGGVATPYGRDAGRVWVLTPTTGEVESVVVYLHGWGARLPFEWHLVWLEHLLSHGSAVLFPEYQDGVDDAFVVAPYDLRVGLQLGFRALREQGVPVVAAGFSVGATLAFVYAAAADAWDVPKPQAVYSIFPVDPLQIDPALDLSGLHETKVVLLAGDRDETVGRYGADSLAEQLVGLPRSNLRYEIVRSGDDLLGDHEAPTYVADPAVRATFWRPLDELVEDVR